MTLPELVSEARLGPHGLRGPNEPLQGTGRPRRRSLTRLSAPGDVC